MIWPIRQQVWGSRTKVNLGLKVTTCIFALLAILIADELHGPGINNGDFWRASRSLFIQVENWKPLIHCASSGDLNLRGLIPFSTIGLFGSAYSIFSKLSGHACFNLELYFRTLSLFYFAGVFALQKYLTKCSFIISSIFFAIIYLSLSHYFKSLYEEAFVLALSPWLAFSLLHFKHDRGLWLFVTISGLILFSKSQMFFALPLIILYLASCSRKATQVRKIKHLVAGVFLAALSASSLYKNAALELNQPNAYNRIFNGMGWSIQGVSDWPAGNFAQRNAYFEANRDLLQTKSKPLEGIAGLRLFGTSYWPTGFDLLKMYPGPALRDEISFKNYIKLYVQDPGLIQAAIKSTFSVLVRSNYNLDYIKTRRHSSAQELQPIQQFNDLFGRSIGMLFLAIGIGGFIANPKPWWRAAMVYYFLGAPVFVFIGDGFYEFEKHMMPAFMLLPAFAALLMNSVAQQGLKWKAPQPAL